VSAAVAIIVTPVGILLDEFLVDFISWMPGISPVVRNGILPMVFFLVGIMGFYWLVKKKYAATHSEAIQSVFILIVAAFIILTIVGIWFRGKGMALMWPWEIVN
jgi:hypothetical protein